MDIKNTPLLFQSQLNQHYKDILNCEITHPSYRAGKVPETFFLRRRKGIEAYHDWGGDDILDYINFDWEEYAIVRFDKKIRIMKRDPDIQTTDVSKVISMWRIIEPKWWELDFTWWVGSFTITSQYMKRWGSKCYIFSVAERSFEWVATKELFVTEYQLLSPGNIDYSVQWKTYWVRALSGIIDDSKVQAIFSNTGASIFVSVESKRKLYQVKLRNNWDLTSFYNEYTESVEKLPINLSAITDLAISKQTDRLYFVSWNYRIWCMSFRYNDITKDNVMTVYSQMDWSRKYEGIDISADWKYLYLTHDWKIYQYTFKTYYQIDKWFDSWVFECHVANEDNMVQTLQTTEDWQYFYVQQENKYIVQLWFAHAKILAEQNYSPWIHHSFKRNFQSVRGECLMWSNWHYYANGTTTWTEATWYITIKNAWVTVEDMATNQFAGKYIFFNGKWYQTWWGWSWSWTGQVININSNTNNQLLVTNWAEQPINAKCYIFEDYWEVLAFVWWDWLYLIHNENIVLKYEWLWKAVIDADWNAGRVFAILDNGNVFCSATRTSNEFSSLSWWYYAGLFNNYSMIWSTNGALRIIPFNDIMIVFTKTWIYVIKQETLTVGWDSITTYILTLAFDFVWLHSANAVCPYNTGIYFVSNKHTFLSLDIQETYYNKYKITTQDLWVDIQQRLDNIKDEDEVSIWIDTETIYVTWNSDSKATIFQYDTFFSFWHRWETELIIKNIRVDNNQTYLWPICYRYNLTEKELDEGEQNYTQQLRWFNGEADIFSLKTILYHELYLWTDTDLSTVVKYNARLSIWTYEYIIPLNNALFIQRNTNIVDDWILWHGLVGITPLWWSAEQYAVWEYTSDVDVLEIPLWLTYSLLEIAITWKFEIWWNILWSFVHDPHLTPYDDVVWYLDDNT